MFLKTVSSLLQELVLCCYGILGGARGCLGAKGEVEPQGLNVSALEEMHDHY